MNEKKPKWMLILKALEYIQHADKYMLVRICNEVIEKGYSDKKEAERRKIKSTDYDNFYSMHDAMIIGAKLREIYILITSEIEHKGYIDKILKGDNQ